MPEAALDGTHINNCTVRLLNGDITNLDLDAFVFYAQHDLALGSGFGTAISVRGGPTVQKELDGLGPLATGDAVTTGAGNLKVKHIIHAVGPRFQEDDIEGKLRTTMVNTLRQAEEHGIARIAFPAMGAGYYGIAPDLCARVMLDVIRDHLEGETGIRDVVICALDERQYKAFQAPLEALN